ncbi:Leucine aminopeptidase 1 [Lunasporangiospora selenospora]|uniref:Peptide hydrolase n=1 Tax=Lunasporangiospora selenospora TaxID=979761 RepID=A0A9P6FND8_9FUNG|nr:Leucine aminopeptidase 1 [Lunasporangiospora selenospora]
MVKPTTFAILSLVAANALAAPTEQQQPFTLTKSLGRFGLHPPQTPCHDSVTQPEWETLRLIKTAKDKAPLWIRESQILELIRAKTRFMDITGHEDLGTPLPNSALNHPALPRIASQQEEFAYHVGDLDKEYMKKVLDVIKKSEADVSLRKFKHYEWNQFSIIARFEGRDAHLSNAPIIIGAHLDSVNAWVPMLGRSPGADDDGSGTVLILDVLRVLAQKGFRPERPVEFHWYSAEEAGMLGSQDVAHHYKKRGVNVFAMLQNDQSGFVRSKDEEILGIIIDYVDPELTNLLKLYAKEYADIPVRETECGYACSDHASWTEAGYRAAVATESVFNNQSPYIHGEDDDLSTVDFDHMMQIAKLNLGFVVELGNFKGPVPGHE